MRQKERAQRKRFSYGLRSPKPLDKKIQKFLPHPISGEFVKRVEKKKLVKKTQKVMNFELKVRQAKCGFLKVS